MISSRTGSGIGTAMNNRSFSVELSSAMALNLLPGSLEFKTGLRPRGAPACRVKATRRLTPHRQMDKSVAEVRAGGTPALPGQRRPVFYSTLVTRHSTLNCMSLPADYHMHTPLCRHATGEPGEYAARAVVVGLTEIGFSDHSPMRRDDFDDWRMRFDQLDEYVGKVR